MLTVLHVKNLALIDEVEIEFGPGLNILTGETGAGKSVLIGSINLALGDKADATVIRDGAEYALIEMIFQIDDPKLLAAIRERDLPVEEDGQLILQRKISPNRSSCKVCGETVTLKQLKELSHLLITIHGQNDQLSLLSERSQKQILDAFDEKHVLPLKKDLAEHYNVYLEQKRKLDSCEIDEQTRLREMDLISYELNEIDEADLTIGEDEQLESVFRKLSNCRKLADAAATVHQCLLEGESNITDLTGEAIKQMINVVGMDPTLNDVLSSLRDLESLVTDITRTMGDYLSELDIDENRLDEITARLNLVNRMKEKYAHGTDRLEDVLTYAKEKQLELDKLRDLEEYRKNAAESMQLSFSKVCELSDQLTKCRKKAGALLAPRLEEALRQLNFENVSFEVLLHTDHDKMTADGCDETAFLISLNPGENPRPLQKVSSGGELSRIMLALKTVLSEKNDSMAMIFDEIDAGISGKTAWRVSQKLGELSRNRQVICITHLAQIASMADTHFEIYKDSSSGRSITHIRSLSESESVKELARLLGTDGVSDTSLQAAQKMRTEADHYKSHIG